MTKRLLFMSRPPDDEEARLERLVLAGARRTLGLPPTKEPLAR